MLTARLTPSNPVEHNQAICMVLQSVRGIPSHNIRDYYTIENGSAAEGLRVLFDEAWPHPPVYCALVERVSLTV